MCSPVHALRTQRRKKKKRFISGTMCYCKGNYSVNVSVFELVENELGFEKNGPKNRAFFILFFRYKLVKLDRVYKSLQSVNSVKLANSSDFSRN